MRGRCQRCLSAGEVIPTTYMLASGQVVTRRLCEHCSLHWDTPAMNCRKCFPEMPPEDADG